MITRAPENIPADPTPATARPTIRALDVGAEPHTADPTSKIKMAVKKTVLILKNVYSFPKNSCRAHVVKRYDEPYQPTSLRELKWSVILGIAVAIIVLSSAMRKTARAS